MIVVEWILACFAGFLILLGIDGSIGVLIAGLLIIAFVFRIEYKSKETVYIDEPKPGTRAYRKPVALVLCIFFGLFGVHKFYERKYGMGLLYLCTFGLLFGGWIVDIAVLAFAPDPYYLVDKQRSKRQKREDADAERRRDLETGKVAVYEEDVTCVSGLNESVGASCHVEVYIPGLVIATKTHRYSIPMERIRGAESIDTVDRNIINGGGVGRAIVWDFLAGPAAGIAASANRVQNVDIHRYFTSINYVTSGGEDAYIVVENNVPDSIRIQKNGKRSLFGYNAQLCSAIQQYARAGVKEETL